MFQRNALLDLQKWSNKSDRKPLILRGARQVGIWSGVYGVDKVFTPKGKEFNLVNVPFYYIGQLESILSKLFH